MKKAASRRTGGKAAQTAAFGGAIYQLRIERDFSQEELAFESGIDRSYLSKLELGEKEPCLGIMFKLSTALKTSPSDILARAERLFKEGYEPGRNARVR